MGAKKGEKKSRKTKKKARQKRVRNGKKRKECQAKNQSGEENHRTNLGGLENQERFDIKWPSDQGKRQSRTEKKMNRMVVEIGKSMQILSKKKVQTRMEKEKKKGGNKGMEEGGRVRGKKGDVKALQNEKVKAILINEGGADRGKNREFDITTLLAGNTGRST